MRIFIRIIYFIRGDENVPVTVRKILKTLKKDGWYITNQKGSHIQLKHPMKKGKITVPNHNGDIAKGTEDSIYRQAGLK